LGIPTKTVLFRSFKPVFLLLAGLLFLATGTQAQFYNGSNMTFGKNRVQYTDFLWTYYKFDDFDTYFYLNGKELAQYTARYAQQQIPLIENKMESHLDKRIQFIIFNTLTDLKQSNIGLITNESYNTGGVTHIIGSKVFLYFDGNNIHFEDEIRAGIAEVMFNQMMFGGSLGKQVKTSTFFSLPDWYKVGIVSWLSKDWDVEFDNRVRDGILSGRYKKVNNLTGEDAIYAGHSLWRFIAIQYGRAAVSNIIHMTSVSNSIDKGILYVLGIPFKTLVNDWRSFYQKEYEQFAAEKEQPSGLLKIKYKSDIVFGQPTVSPFGKYVAYTTNEMGKYKIYLQDLASNKRKKILKKGVMIDTKTDYSYPLLTWHPSGKLLAYIIEDKGLPWLCLYNVEEKKTTKQVIYEVQKITDFSYSDDGRFMVMSAVRKGQSDIYVFNISASTFQNITNDIYSERSPCFINNSSQIVFSSNRENDTLGIQPKDILDMPKHFDLFAYDLSGHNPVLKRITQTPLASEFRPEQFGFNTISYLSDENGIYNNYLAVIDSTVSSVDTAIHYRYFVHSKAISDFPGNIIDQHTSPKAGKKAMLYFENNLWKIYINDISDYASSSALSLTNTNYMAGLKNMLKKEIQKKENIREQLTTDTIDRQEIVEMQPTKTKTKHFVMVYIDNKGNEYVGKPKKKTGRKGKLNQFGSYITSIDGKQEDDEFVIPKRRNYYVEYFINDMISQIDFNYINYNYQNFTGGGPIYLNPGFNIFFQMGVNDLMEDHRFVGGVRFNFSLTNNEYIFSYSNLKKRLDKEIVFHRNTTPPYNNTIFKVHTHELFYILKWPFNEALSLRGTAKYRNDMFVTSAIEQSTLETPNQFANWVGLKGELVFDNTRSLGMNIYVGTRYKIFAEYDQMIGLIENGGLVDLEQKYNLFVLGVDYRHYTRIHRNFIWANRFAASTSFGASPLIYYMGGVDNWVAPKFNYQTPIDYSQNYAYQTLATNMRGFNQNIRNGSSFMLINSELRFPIFQYFSKTPLSSGFLRNFQFVGFGDIGTAWTGPSPYSKENSLYTRYVDSGPFHISVEVQKEPIVGGFGAGVRMHLLGYFIRGDVSWGVDDYKVGRPVYYFSLSLDF
jgi:Tol biopolymer transport system component